MELEPAAPRSNYFAAGIALSLILHLVSTVILVGLPSGPRGSESVHYVDLTFPSLAAPPPAAPAAPPAPPAPPAMAEKAVADEPAAPQVTPQPEAPQAATATAAAPQTAAPPQEQRSATPFGMGLTKGYFKSFGEGETLRPGVKEYFIDMLQGINEKWWVDQSLDKMAIMPVLVSVRIARNGEIVAAQLMASSGNRRYDRAVLAALQAAGPLPPLPKSFPGEYFEAPLRLVPPLNLMAW
ncbi:energy transducer TonB [Geomonas sp. Red32]|uniref:energy transducer TonB n=1 Tax=Geomonas sp. Red32 TaxID=2912856 RepID=UPI00202CA7BC|nr:energy transducer TonB [Geomonas sp. Red32]